MKCQQCGGTIHQTTPNNAGKIRYCKPLCGKRASRARIKAEHSAPKASSEAREYVEDCSPMGSSMAAWRDFAW